MDVAVGARLAAVVEMVIAQYQWLFQVLLSTANNTEFVRCILLDPLRTTVFVIGEKACPRPPCPAVHPPQASIRWRFVSRRI